MKKDYETMTVGEIVADNFGNAEVFDKYGIDFCCHGSILLPKASQKAGADMDEVINEKAGSICGPCKELWKYPSASGSDRRTSL